MKEYFKHVYQQVDGLNCILRIVDREHEEGFFPAIELIYSQNGRKKVSFAALKDVSTGVDLVPGLAKCFKDLVENKKEARLSKCKKCKEDFAKKHPAQKYCSKCKPGKRLETVTVGDIETGDNN